MPYITKQRRQQVIPSFENDTSQTAGELNYSITVLLQTFLNKQGLSYQTINDIVGALEGAKLEFYRRVVVPYENKKIKSNGDVYEIDS